MWTEFSADVTSDLRLYQYTYTSVYPFGHLNDTVMSKKLSA